MICASNDTGLEKLKNACSLLCTSVDGLHREHHHHASPSTKCDVLTSRKSQRALPTIRNSRSSIKKPSLDPSRENDGLVGGMIRMWQLSLNLGLFSAIFLRARFWARCLTLCSLRRKHCNREQLQQHAILLAITNVVYNTYGCNIYAYNICGYNIYG